jgi:hypothetical protein
VLAPKKRSSSSELLGVYHVDVSDTPPVDEIPEPPYTHDEMETLMDVPE